MTELEIVKRCEAQLGWVAPRGVALWKARGIEVTKLKRAMTKAGVSVQDLAIALEMSRRQHKGVDSPVALVYRVQEARELAAEATPKVGIDVQVQEAVDFEMTTELPGWETWVSRLTRCSGPARAEVFEEWAAQRLVEVA